MSFWARDSWPKQSPKWICHNVRQSQFPIINVPLIGSGGRETGCESWPATVGTPRILVPNLSLRLACSQWGCHRDDDWIAHCIPHSMPDAVYSINCSKNRILRQSGVLTTHWSQSNRKFLWQMPKHIVTRMECPNIRLSECGFSFGLCSWVTWQLGRFDDLESNNWVAIL